LSLNLNKSTFGIRNLYWMLGLAFFLFVVPSGIALRQRLVNKAEDVFDDVIAGDTSVLPSGEDPYHGNVQFKVNEMDVLASAAVTPTTPSYLLFLDRPGLNDVGRAITSSGTTTDIPPEVKGIVYMAIYGGSDFYILEDQFRSANRRVTSCYWEDFDQDGDDDFVAKLDLSAIGTPGQDQTPTVTIELPLADIDVASWADDNPADITDIATSESVQSVTWKLTGITAGDGAYITELYFATNDSRAGNDLKFEEVTISGGWATSSGCPTYFSKPIDEESQYYVAWYYKAADDREYHQGMRVWRRSNEPDTLYITANIRCTLETSDSLTVDLYLTLAQPDGTTTEVNDQVGLLAVTS